MSKPKPEQKIMLDVPRTTHDGRDMTDEEALEAVKVSLTTDAFLLDACADSARLVTLNDALVEKVARAMWGSGWKPERCPKCSRPLNGEVCTGCDEPHGWCTCKPLPKWPEITEEQDEQA